MKSIEMAKRKLEARILRVVAEKTRQGKSLRAADLVAGKLGKQIDEDDPYSIREAIWNLLATHQLELTDERLLRPATEEKPLAKAV